MVAAMMLKMRKVGSFMKSTTTATAAVATSIGWEQHHSTA